MLDRLLADFGACLTAGAVATDEFDRRVSLLSSQPLDAVGLRLAFDCLRGDERALNELKDVLDGALATIGRDLLSDDDLRADLCQQTYVLLLYGGPRAERPYLLTYGGRAPLRVWLRTALVRQCVLLKRRRQKEQPLDLAMADLVADRQHGNPELELLKQRYAREFRLAFRQSLASLSARDRLVLRHHLIERLTAEQIGRRFRVHRVTVVRWMQRIRRMLLKETASNLTTLIRKDMSELETIFGLIESRLQVSFSKLESTISLTP